MNRIMKQIADFEANMSKSELKQKYTMIQNPNS